ncbi:hypothetical protein L486_01248 [Kwoniella mangroviensis CBS 10435]|uniref:Uncharacterized protein n=1 Tax=Kwoniella mangroviensis CBS 10435 TaxID=1331196 RepID=A0A1B9J1C5_9TREE|nr:hypothetical protein L486_01248 [Kwoniella mangroviensis CBS 10435]
MSRNDRLFLEIPRMPIQDVPLWESADESLELESQQLLIPPSPQTRPPSSQGDEPVLNKSITWPSGQADDFQRLGPDTLSVPDQQEEDERNGIESLSQSRRSLTLGGPIIASQTNAGPSVLDEIAFSNNLPKFPSAYTTYQSGEGPQINPSQIAELDTLASAICQNHFFLQKIAGARVSDLSMEEQFALGINKSIAVDNLPQDDDTKRWTALWESQKTALEG